MKLKSIKTNLLDIHVLAKPYYDFLTLSESSLFNLQVEAYELAFITSIPVCVRNEGRYEIVSNWLPSSNMKKRGLALPPVCTIALLDQGLAEPNIASYSYNYILQIMSLCLRKESAVMLLSAFLLRLDETDKTLLLGKCYKKNSTISSMMSILGIEISSVKRAVEKSRNNSAKNNSSIYQILLSENVNSIGRK